MAQLPVKKRRPPLDFTLDFTLGEGSEIVYVYYNPREADYAALKKRGVWPCKIGRTTRADPWDRILEYAQTATSFHPRLICLYTNFSFRLESFLHRSCPKVEDALGSEWRLTNPHQIKALYSQYLKKDTLGEGRPTSDSRGDGSRVRMSDEAYEVFVARAQASGQTLREYFDELAGVAAPQEAVAKPRPVSGQGELLGRVEDLDDIL